MGRSGTAGYIVLFAALVPPAGGPAAFGHPRVPAMAEDYAGRPGLDPEPRLAKHE